MAVKTQINTVLVNEYSGSAALRCLVRGPSGRFWSCYTEPGSNTLYAAYSDDNGVTWTEELVDGAVDAHSATWSMVVDNTGVPHIFWGSAGGLGGNDRFLRHAHRTGGVWATETVYDVGVGVDVNLLSACIDASDVIYLCCWAGWVVNSLYFSGTTGAWAAPETIPFPIFSVNAVDVDGSGVIFAVGQDGLGNAALTRRVGGVWQALEVVGVAITLPVTSLDNLGSLHVAWLETVAGWDIIRYRKRSSGGVWGASINAIDDWSGADDALSPSLSVDASGNAYIIAQKDDHGGDESVYFKQITAAGVVGALTVFDAAILMPNALSSVYTSLGHGCSASSVLPAAACPVAVLLSEDGVNADAFFESRVLAPTVQTNPATGVT